MLERKLVPHLFPFPIRFSFTAMHANISANVHNSDQRRLVVVGRLYLLVFFLRICHAHAYALLHQPHTQLSGCSLQWIINIDGNQLLCQCL